MREETKVELKYKSPTREQCNLGAMTGCTVGGVDTPSTMQSYKSISWFTSDINKSSLFFCCVFWFSKERHLFDVLILLKVRWYQSEVFVYMVL